MNDDFAESLKHSQLRTSRVSVPEYWDELRTEDGAFAIIVAAGMGTPYDRVVVDNISLLIEGSDLGLGTAYFEGWAKQAPSGTAHGAEIRMDAVLIRTGTHTRSSEHLLANARLLAMRYHLRSFLFRPARESSLYLVDQEGMHSLGHLREGLAPLVSRLYEGCFISFESVRFGRNAMDRWMYHLKQQAKGLPVNSAYELARDETRLFGKKWISQVIRSEPHQKRLAEAFGFDALVHACRLRSAKVLIAREIILQKEEES
jgi:hypothetical protein